MADVKMDLDKLDTTINTYTNYSKELLSVIDGLKSTISKLESEWAGKAKSAFVDEHFPKLCEVLEDHVAKISMLNDQLKYVKTEFSTLDS